MAILSVSMISRDPCCGGSARSGLRSGFLGHRSSGARWEPRRRRGGHRSSALVAVAGMDWMDAFHGIVIGVGVGLPCTVMECGDVVYRSTLPKSNSLQVTGPGAALAVLAVTYLWATPGVAPGFWDMFLLAPIEKRLRPSYTKDDFVLEKKIGEGAFGSVYKGSFANPQKKSFPVVVKKASEYGEVEAWMNQRVRRACPGKCADYLDGFKMRVNPKRKEFWLVWRYEGVATLADFMSSKDFPYNVEKALSLKTTQLAKGAERENQIIQSLLQELLKCLRGLHDTGIVHRDIKPQNIIFSDESKSFKIIDLGAATDLRVGINYIPQEFLLDPRYAAPEQYIMSTQTPSAPSPVIATALSPVLWQLNLPDRFDIYSLGLMFLQMVFSNLRSDSALIQFNRQLKRVDHDLVAWRDLVDARPNADVQRGFEILDMDGGAGWELLQAMMQFKGRQRISAKAALGHPYFVKLGLLKASPVQTLWLGLIRFAQQDRTQALQWVLGLMAKGFTEAELEELREREPKKKSTFQRNALASALRLQRKVAQTVAASVDEKMGKRKIWWMETIDETLDGLETKKKSFWWI
ncbi:serine/threonine-protein kinase STN7, chloroplastic isoform X1 [Selaginella moellendorffii]|uniref:serine/threonine-protein kinase STN7, chloroplastic isoform X1 n=1 Tax=Selaginella moellendorffii TaxID=88036 RepID=UPI000D1D0BD9|nr:serine/threonine-protein kinase STN7, chloroplastic isoform X1 [Selaginella moellendorffii]|eukprot:XP_024525647.1 serine/threonine-protein kinase STN7, chloroplastic isoform X1 [Selaginella moellendorffii]